MASSPSPPVRELFGDMVARHLYRPMARAGFVREGRRLWRELRGDAWALIELRLSSRSSQERVMFTVGAAAWPPGTWPAYRAWLGVAEERWPGPVITAVGPILAWHGELTPTLWPGRDLLAFDASSDARQLGRELLAFCDQAIPWARSHCEVETALRHLTRPPMSQPALRFAAEMLSAAAPAHPRRPEVVDQLTTRWIADPRPITLRGQIERWRAETGLPRADNLPTYWHPAMLDAERLGWPEAAYLLGDRGEFWLADGTRTTVPPPDWPRRPRRGPLAWLRRRT